MLRRALVLARAHLLWCAHRRRGRAPPSPRRRPPAHGLRASAATCARSRAEVAAETGLPRRDVERWFAAAQVPAQDRRADGPAAARAAEVVRVRAAVPRAGAHRRRRAFWRDNEAALARAEATLRRSRRDHRRDHRRRDVLRPQHRQLSRDRRARHARLRLSAPRARSSAASSRSSCCSRATRASRRSRRRARSPARWACRSSCRAAIAGSRSTSTATATPTCGAATPTSSAASPTTSCATTGSAASPCSRPRASAPEARDTALRRLDGGISERRPLAAWQLDGVTLRDATAANAAGDPVGLLLLEESAARATREPVDRVSQLLRDHALQQEPAVRGRGVGARRAAARGSSQRLSMPDDCAPIDDLPLREDTRLLGRLLGDVVRACNGERDLRERRGASARPRSAFAARTRTSAAAVRRRARRRCSTTSRSRARSPSCARSPISRISRTSPRTCTRIAAGARTRSPARRRSAAASTPRSTHLAKARRRRREARRGWLARRAGQPGADRASDRSAAQEHPRLRARDRAPPQLRDRTALTPDEIAEWETDLYRQVLSLWQTAMLRLSKLKVRDEIENGLAYYRYTFLTEVPRLYEALAAGLARTFGDGVDVPPFLRMGSWIGGDRDGNPFVIARDARVRDPRAGGGRVRPLPRRGASGSAPSCRCPRAWSSRRPRCSHWPRPRTTPIRIARTSRIGRR